MALQKGKYYVENIRVGDKVKTRYLGVCYAVFADADRLIREEKEQERKALKIREAEQTERYEQERDRFKGVYRLVVIGLEAMGFRHSMAEHGVNLKCRPR